MKKIGILACVLIVLLLTSCKSTSLQAILRDKPFDWTDSFEYDFMYHDQKYDLQSIESLSEEQLNAYYEAPPVTVYLVCDSDTQIATIYEEKQPDANDYYLLDPNGTRAEMMIIPIENRIQFFEQVRPLAFFLKRTDGK